MTAYEKKIQQDEQVHDADEARQSPQRTCLLVLGMHRSGTSALTRVLSLAGARLPARLLGASTGNELGHWEPAELVAYHDRVLRQLGSSWQDWAPLDFKGISLDQVQFIYDNIVDIVAHDYGKAELFVIKEPRICRFASMFMRILQGNGIDVVPIIPIRNPLEVISSLEARDGMSRVGAAFLWLRHILDAELASRGCRRVLTDYEYLLSDWRVELEKIVAASGVQFPYAIDDIASEVETFIRPDLRHHVRSTTDVHLDPLLHGWVSDTFEALRILIRTPENAHALAQLDSVRESFNLATPSLKALSDINDVTREERDKEAQRAAAAEAARDEEAQRAAVAEAARDEEAQRAAVAEAARDEEAQRAAAAEAARDEEAQRAAAAEAARDEEAQRAAVAETARDEEARRATAAEAARDEEARRAAAAEAARDEEARRAAAAEAARDEEAQRAAAAQPARDEEAWRADVAEAARDEEARRAAAAEAARDEQVHRLQELQAEYERSTSWRLTAPIRRVKRAQIALAGSLRALSTAVRIRGLKSKARKVFRIARFGRLRKYIPINSYINSYMDGGISSNAPTIASSMHPTSQCRYTILFVTHDMHVGGAPFVLKTLAEWFHQKTRFCVKIVAMRNGPLEHDFRATGIPLITLFSGDEDVVEANIIKDSLKKFAGESVSCVIINSVASARFLDYWTESNTKIISYVHELEQIIQSLGDNIEKIKQRSDLVVAGSQIVRNVLINKFAFDKDKIEVIYDFVEEYSSKQKICEGNEKKRQELGLPTDARVVMACGTLHWRKWPEKFIEVAQMVLEREPSINWQFVWIGGGEQQIECEQMVRKLDLGHIIHFIGYRQDVCDDLQAADIFLLTSKEDPFPLVCLYAALNEAPIICFADAGGMPEFVTQGCGLAVPYGDASAMANGVIEYARAETSRKADGARAREVALAGHTVATAGPAFLANVRRLCSIPPHVSVIVPNFNYATFLVERLDSIYNQSFQDFEVILLDDSSTDSSISILEKYCKTHPSTRLIVNEKNTGSPFAQWLKGMHEAEADLIWIAEADDYCEPDLLQSAVDALADRNVFLAYTKSVPVDSNGKVLGDYEDLYLNRINDKHWSQSCRLADHAEILEALGIANSIPNASSVVFRRFEPEDVFVKTVTNMKMCGDWYFYIRAIRGGLVSYINGGVNYHRRHGGTVTHKMEGSQRYFNELRDTRKFIESHYHVPAYTREKAKHFTEQDIHRFGITDPARAQAIIDETTYNGHSKDMPSLLVVASDLGPGGGQMFSIRLANAWVARGGRAVLLNAEMYPTHEQVFAKISPRVPLFSARAADYSLNKLVNDFGLDVIHSSIWWADRLIHDDIHEISEQIPWIVSMHGCYETLLEHPNVDRTFQERFKDMKRRVSYWVYTAEKNKAVFEQLGWPANTSKIPNGYEPEPVTEIPRDKLGLRPDSLVVCLASRAIESKGWLEAVEAVRMLNEQGHKVDLMLIGEGPVADQLRVAHLPPYVRLYGQVSDLQNYIAVCDIGLLPSYFVGESMPLVIIEMLAQGKPVIATRVGEIPDMLIDETGACGKLIDLIDGKVFASDIAKAIADLLDPATKQYLGALGLQNFRKNFQIEAMLKAYSSLYYNNADPVID